MDFTSSYGIINLYIQGELEQYGTEICKILNTHHYYNTSVSIDKLVYPVKDKLFKKCVDMVSANLLFLLISRKHSIAYIEFLRGNYEEYSDDSIKTLFSQMSEEEINLIFNDNFDDLWLDLWRTNFKKSIGSREYVYVKDKYNAILTTYKKEDFKPKYPLKEWGFPKGRKNNLSESALSCAIRECIEETGLYKNEINVLMSVYPVVEDLIGTNGKLYRLIYFISIVKRMRKLVPIENEDYFSEIDDIGWFLRHKISNLFRPYHVKKIEVVDKIINFIAYTVYCIKYL